MNENFLEEDTIEKVMYNNLEASQPIFCSSIIQTALKNQVGIDDRRNKIKKNHEKNLSLGYLRVKKTNQFVNLPHFMILKKLYALQIMNLFKGVFHIFKIEDIWIE